jgi:hypothetical protein
MTDLRAYLKRGTEQMTWTDRVFKAALGPALFCGLVVLRA